LGDICLFGPIKTAVSLLSHQLARKNVLRQMTL
jgi:hypothetical protein